MASSLRFQLATACWILGVDLILDFTFLWRTLSAFKGSFDETGHCDLSGECSQRLCHLGAWFPLLLGMLRKCRKYVTGGGPREFKGLGHFRFALCFLLEIEDVSSQFLALAAMPVSYCGLPALVDFSLFGNISQNAFSSLSCSWSSYVTTATEK